MQRGFLCVVSLQAFWRSDSDSNTLHLAWISSSVTVAARQKFQCCPAERSAYRGKDPISTPTCSACFKPGLRKKDTCVDLQSHVPESELPSCFAFTSLGKSNVSATDTAPVREEPAQSP